MKIHFVSCLLALSLAANALANCDTGMHEMELKEATKLSFVGFTPEVTRKVNMGEGNKIVLKNYGEYNLQITEDSGRIEIARGDPCETTITDTPADSAANLLMFGAPLLFGGQKNGMAATALTLGLAALVPSAFAQTECSSVPIEVDIYVEAMVEDLVNRLHKAGEYNECAPETMYWEHDPGVFGGYSGCLAERGLYPCESDALGVNDEGGEFYPLSSAEYWDGEKCVEGVDFSSRLFWARGGHPMDKHELNARTGDSPVVALPFTRQPYPSYRRGTNVDTGPQDESNDARLKAKEMLEFVGAFTETELEDYDVTITEGAEQGMVHLFAAKAMEIARTTCNRDIYVLVEAPSYGYSTSYAAKLANDYASSFYNSSECMCFADDSCLEPTVTLNYRGWFPGTPLPVEMGGDGNMYSADADTDASPFFESLVFPENPSGVFKVPQLPNSNRRVCDGVYLWPMYMGARDFVMPKDEIPDCSGWAFSISKIYSAAARAGWIMYKEEPATSHDAIVTAIGSSQTLTQGSLSQWTWEGQMQLMDFFMSKPLDDPTSWIGAYSGLMKEKWEYIIDGFKDCPMATLSNPYSGAYAWFVTNPEYVGVEEGNSAPSWMRDLLGVRAHTYSWGMRGADPSDYYGEGYGNYDFVRMHMYRDVNVYKEIGRRAKMICSDKEASLGGGLVSFNQWESVTRGTSRRRLQEGYKTPEDRRRHLKEVVPELTDEQVEFVAQGQELNERESALIESCAPEYTTECLFSKLDPDQDAFYM